jgi:serine/threonine protein kinase
MPGQLIGQRYRIIRPLGQGGMASVYLVEDVVLGEKEVAIKVLQTPANDDAGLSDRFIREVRLTHKIQHENVVRTFDFGRDDRLLYYTMEYQRGVPLDTVLNGKPLPLAVVMRMAWQLFRGAVAIHSVGVIHRDIKPSNLILNDQGVLKITDFGVARLNSSPATVAAGDILGTVLYIAPEVLQGAIPSRAVDFYAIGVVLYEALTGRVPFVENNPARLIVRKIDEVPPAVKSLRSDAPTWLAEGIDGLLRADPELRMRVVNSLAARLEAERGVSEFGLLRDDLLANSQVDNSRERSWLRASCEALLSRLARMRLFAAALCAVLLIPFSQLELAGLVENSNIDTLFKARGVSLSHPDVAVVAMDEQSYRDLGVPLNSAWPRRLHAKLLHALADAGARRVVFDIIFSGADESNPDDIALAEAMKRVPTVLGAALGFSQRATINGAFMLEELIQPELLFERQSVGIGVVGLPQRLGRIGGFFESSSEVFPNLRSLSEMAVALDRGVTEQPDARARINFYGGRGTIPTVPYEMVVAPNGAHLPAEVLRDKIVFVGLALRSSTGPAQRDAFVTPFDAATFGTEVHATAASNLLANDWIRRLSRSRQLLAMAVTTFISVLLVAGAYGARGVLRVALLFGVVATTEYVLFISGWFVPLVLSALWGAACGYILRLGTTPWGKAVVRRKGVAFYGLMLTAIVPTTESLAAPIATSAARLVLEAPVPDAEFGAGLSCTGVDGSGVGVVGDSLVAAGAPAEGLGSGAVYVFNQMQGGSALVRLIAPDLLGARRFGAAVDFVGDLNGDGVSELVVGAPGDGSAEGRGYLIAFLSQLSYGGISYGLCASYSVGVGYGARLYDAPATGPLGAQRSEAEIAVGREDGGSARLFRIRLRGDLGCEFSERGAAPDWFSSEAVATRSERPSFGFSQSASVNNVERFTVFNSAREPLCSLAAGAGESFGAAAAHLGYGGGALFNSYNDDFAVWSIGIDGRSRIDLLRAELSGCELFGGIDLSREVTLSEGNVITRVSLAGGSGCDLSSDLKGERTILVGVPEANGVWGFKVPNAAEASHAALVDVEARSVVPIAPTPTVIAAPTDRPSDGTGGRPSDAPTTPSPTPTATPSPAIITVAPDQVGLPAPEVLVEKRAVSVVLPRVRPVLDARQQRVAIRRISQRTGLSAAKASRLLSNPNNLEFTYIVSVSSLQSRASSSLIPEAHADQAGSATARSTVRRIRSRNQRVTISRLTPGVDYVVWYQVEISLKNPKVVLGTTKPSRTRRFSR